MAETTLHPYSKGSEVSGGSKSASPDISIKLNATMIQVRNADVTQRKGLIVVIPAFNEEIALGSVVLQARQYADKVIVVDDGSSDRTTEIAKMAGAEVISLEYNAGKAYALLIGLKRARELDCKAVVMMDADGQHHARDILRIAAPAMNGDADLVIGSRFLEKNGHTPIYRRLGQKTLDIFTNIGTKQNVTDSQSGFRALSRKALDYLDFKSNGYNVESDMIAHFAANGLVMREVPVNVRYKVPNMHKKHPVSHGMGVLSQLISLIGYRRPLIAFGLPGGIFVIVGIVTGFFAFREYYATTRFPFAMSMVSMVFLVMGLLMVIAGLILNFLVILIKEQKLQ
jgi:glycosyltransferase involved in cell wall biosynthesis